MQNRIFHFIITGVLWFGVLLWILLAVVPAFQVNTDERICELETFETKYNFACNTKCVGDNKGEQLKTCESEQDRILSKYNPWLCHKSKWGHDDILCPPEYTLCDGGPRNVYNHSLCHLYCPLSYEMILVVRAEGIQGTVTKVRETEDRIEWNKLDQFYSHHDTFHCQVKRGERDVLWQDEQFVTSFAWWKWTVFAMYMFGTIVYTIIVFTRRRHDTRSVRVAAAGASENAPLLGSEESDSA